MPSTTRHVPYGSIAAALYAISLLIPAVVVIQKPLLWGAPHDQPIFGLHCLMLGWGTVPWYANFMLWSAAIALAFRRPRLAAVSSLAAIGLALTIFLYLDTLIRAPHVGYFVWLASMVLMLVAACADSRRRSA